MSQDDRDKTIFVGMEEGDNHSAMPSTIQPVAASQVAGVRNFIPYVAQQTSVSSYTPGLNPLVNAASGLLMILIQIRNKPGEYLHGVKVGNGNSNKSIEHLRARLEAEVRAFETQALASADIEQSQIIASRYVLCTAMDEVIGTSLKNEDGEWAKHGLLSTFHHETWGGEKFFQILDRCMQQPARNLYLLELMYLLLSMGFEGKYGVQDRGPIALETLRDKIYKQARLLRGEPPQDLSKRIEIPKRKNRFYAYVPVWLVGAVFIFAIGVTYMAFSTILDSHASSILSELSTLSGRPKEVLP